VLIYVAIIFFVSSRPSLHVPIGFQFGDKLAHIAEYMVLGLLLARAVRASMRLDWPLTAALLTMLVGMGVGLADELFQSLIPGRESSAFDFVADTVGLLMAQLVYLAIARE
jgi:VanZ family protein